jgi:hypothetical protein
MLCDCRILQSMPYDCCLSLPWVNSLNSVELKYIIKRIKSTGGNCAWECILCSRSQWNSKAQLWRSGVCLAQPLQELHFMTSKRRLHAHPPRTHTHEGVYSKGSTKQSSYDYICVIRRLYMRPQPIGPGRRGCSHCQECLTAQSDDIFSTMRTFLMMSKTVWRCT